MASPKKKEDLEVTEKVHWPMPARPVDKAVGYSVKGSWLDEPADT